eukprot:m.151396 g.151396  ORF g.151396 m.151396 type:complete len:559 (+) comp30758_c0_seq2:284-1960(+)
MKGWVLLIASGTAAALIIGLITYSNHLSQHHNHRTTVSQEHDDTRNSQSVNVEHELARISKLLEDRVARIDAHVHTLLQRTDTNTNGIAPTADRDTNIILNTNVSMDSFQPIGVISKHKAFNTAKLLGGNAAFAAVTDPGSVTKKSSDFVKPSAQICSGRDFLDRTRSEQHAHCFFRHMCIAPGKGDPPKHVATRGHYDWYYVYNQTPPTTSINFTLGVGPHQVDHKVMMGPRIVRLSDFETEFPEFRMENTLTHIFYEFNAENFGHMLTDVMLPIYASMAGFDQLDEDIQLVRFQIDHDLGFSCDYQRNPGWERNLKGWKAGADPMKRPDAHCKRFYKELMPGITSRPVLLMKDLFAKSQTPVCFSKVLVGTPMLSDDCLEGSHGRQTNLHSICNTGRMEQFWNFRSYTKRNLGVLDSKPTQHQIVIWDRRDGSRMFNDLQNVGKRLGEKFSCHVVVVDWATMTIQDQLKLIGNTTVHITGAGGGSFIAIYLPRGATTIRLYKQEFGMEFHFFNYLGYIHTDHLHTDTRGNVNTSVLDTTVDLALRRYETFSDNFAA